MKKIMILLFCTFLSISLAACGVKHQTEGLKTDPAAGETAAVDFIIPADETAQDSGQIAADMPHSSEIDLNGRVEFSAQTVNGDAVGSSIFRDYQLTMINIWGTLCKPCINEMPDLEALYQEMQGRQVNIVGIVANVLGEDGDITLQERAEDAKKILDAKGVTYMNIVFNDELTNSIYGQISGFPTTIFVDGESNVIGKQISGAKSKDEYTKEIEDRLSETAQ